MMKTLQICRFALRNYTCTVFLCALLVAMLGCGTQSTSPSGTEKITTNIPGVSYYSDFVTGSSGQLRLLHGVNGTAGWVTFFVCYNVGGGNLDLDSTVSAGLPVQSMPLGAHQTGLISRSSRANTYWVWARVGKLQIQNNAVVPMN
jgi:hypothetical protein